MTPSARGQALLLVLWAMAVMSFAVFGLLELVQVDLDEVTASERVMIATLLAQSGIALGEHPGLKPGDRVMERRFDDGRRFKVVQISEGGKLQINRLLQMQDRAVLRRLFMQWGLSGDDADVVVDCLLDYVEPGDLRRLNGAKRPQYEAAGRPGLPTGRPLRSTDEMAAVLNFDKVMRAEPNWKEFFTVWGDGQLDLNAAPAELVRAVAGVGSLQAQSFVRQRNGPDGLPFTRDDVTYGSVQAALAALGISPKAQEKIADRFSTSSSVRRVVSTGWIGNVHRTIEALVTVGAKPAILQWEEY